jgi:flagellar FliJ protein
LKKTKRILPVKKIAEFKEQQAAIELGKARRNLEQKQARLAELISYQNEYIQDFHNKGKLGMGPQMFKTFQSFLDKLKLAILEQKQQVKIATKLTAEKQQVWLETRQKVHIYNNVIERFSHEESHDQEKQEQKFYDELANKITYKPSD